MSAGPGSRSEVARRQTDPDINPEVFASVDSFSVCTGCRPVDHHESSAFCFLSLRQQPWRRPWQGQTLWLNRSARPASRLTSLPLGTITAR